MSTQTTALFPPPPPPPQHTKKNDFKNYLTCHMNSSHMLHSNTTDIIITSLFLSVWNFYQCHYTARNNLKQVVTASTSCSNILFKLISNSVSNATEMSSNDLARGGISECDGVLFQDTRGCGMSDDHELMYTCIYTYMYIQQVVVQW